MTLKVEYGLTAEEDLRAIFNWIADSNTAVTYIKRIRARCDQLGDFPSRGTPHKNIAPRLRTTSFERKAIIAYVVEPDRVLILRILHRGRDLKKAFND